MARQDIDLSTAGTWSGGASNIRWLWANNTRPQIDSALVPSDERYLVEFLIQNGGNISMTLAGSQTLAGGGIGDDLTPAFETSGKVRVTIGSNQITVNGPNASDGTLMDASEPYLWTPANATEVDTFYGLYDAESSNPGGTLTLADTDLVPTAYFAPDASNLNQATAIHYAPDANTLNEVTAMYYAPDANTLNQVM